MMRIAIVAGEASGDLLGAGLIRALRERVPDLIVEGIAGPEMQAAGAHSLYPLERLSVMGLVEVLGRYRELHGARERLIAHFIATPPDVFVGIDAPDFTLGMEARLKAIGIPTVHYVSPSVWAWRQGRVKKIGRAVNLMLTLFPFEAAFYQQHGVPVRYVGHPLAEMIPDQADPQAARRALGLALDAEWLALLPGSRMGEVGRLAADFARTAVWLAERRPGLRFVAPMATAATRALFETTWHNAAPGLPITVIDGRSREVMAAADAVLLASGTAALEAMLLKRPMVVAYRLHWLTYWFVRRMLKVPYVSLPNLLAQRPLVPELLQDAATPANLGAAVLNLLENPAAATECQTVFAELHRSLRQGANARAAEAVLELVGWRGSH